jgi:protein ImuB
MGIVASFAIARTPDTAILAARQLPGVTILPPGREVEILGHLPVHALPGELELIETLERWGVYTLAEFAALPPLGVVERLGEAGDRLLRLSLGQLERPLHAAPPSAEFIACQEFDRPVELLEPLLFLLSPLLRDLTAKLVHYGLATDCFTLRCSLDGKREHVRTLEFPVALRDPLAILKQTQLDLEAHPVGAAIHAIEVELRPAQPRAKQNGLFVPGTPEPERLQVLIARLSAVAGANHVGSPMTLNTHRPDAHQIKSCSFEGASSLAKEITPGTFPLAFRYFRPPLAARVETTGSGEPRRITTRRVSGSVVEAAGPWRTSGEWWATTRWQRDEWDVVLQSGALYRIYVDDRGWFVEGSYD